MSDMSVIVIIPARGGSKGIMRKNIGLMAGYPLISYAIKNALALNLADVFVTTDDEEIAEISRLYGASIIMRPSELAQDHITLDPVIHHALLEAEKIRGSKYDIVVTMQPTSPTLSLDSLTGALDQLMTRDDFDTVLSVMRDPSLFWKKSDEVSIPVFKERINRQYMEPMYSETGAFLMSRRSIVTSESRIGINTFLYELDEDEAIDIDHRSDWFTAESILSSRRIIFIVAGNETIGLGHVYRAITLSDNLFGDEVHFLMKSSDELGIQKAREYVSSVILYDNQDDMHKHLSELEPDIIINDILDTSQEYIEALRKHHAFIVNFEDMGPGAELANMVINALYEDSSPQTNHYSGHRFSILRNEFMIFKPVPLNLEVNQILVTFGGTDPNDMTSRTLNLLRSLGHKKIKITVIMGLGYSRKDELRLFAEQMKSEGFQIDLRENVKMMARHISMSDIVITSNGRTTYETASLGVPCISVSQNEREIRHMFSHKCKGFMNLGLVTNLADEALTTAISSLIKDTEIRREMRDAMLHYDIRNGVVRVFDLLSEGFNEWRYQQNLKTELK